MIDAAKNGFRTNGYAASSFSDVLERAGAARGAIYHHFPGGRQELTVAVIASTGENIAAALEKSTTRSPRSSFQETISILCDVVEREQGGYGCPITPAVLDAAGDPAILDAGHAVFVRWQRALIDNYALDESSATLVVAAVEGALVMCRAARSSRPLELVTEHLAPLFPDNGTPAVGAVVGVVDRRGRPSTRVVRQRAGARKIAR